MKKKISICSIERISILEKASQGKVNWANQFSQYLQENIKRK